MPLEVIKMSYYERPLRPDELMHFGILGMKWGIRRFQNPDGSLTNLGKKRLAQGKGRVNKETGLYEKVSRKERKRNAAIKKKRAESLEKARQQQKLAKEGKLSARQMTDKQLDERIARLKKEKEYNDLMKDTRAISKGKSIVKEMLADTTKEAGKKILTAGAIAFGGAVVAKMLGYSEKDGDKEIKNPNMGNLAWKLLQPKK